MLHGAAISTTQSLRPRAAFETRTTGHPGASIATITSTFKQQAGATVFAEGERTEGLYEVVSGIVRLHKLMPDGRRQITGFLAAGHFLNLLLQDNFTHTAEAVTEVTLCRYPRTGFQRMVDQNPSLALRLLAATSDELRAAQDQMLLLGRKTAAEKMASFLLAMAELQGEDSESDVVQIPMARGDIADYLGLTVETVSRTLARLKREALIALTAPTEIKLLDRDRLEELAAGTLGESCP
jgi:CRP/FNR family transcriptional regulator